MEGAEVVKKRSWMTKGVYVTVLCVYMFSRISIFVDREPRPMENYKVKHYGVKRSLRSGEASSKELPLERKRKTV